jgi:hypothetical protein
LEKKEKKLKGWSEESDFPWWQLPAVNMTALMKRFHLRTAPLSLKYAAALHTPNTPDMNQPQQDKACDSAEDPIRLRST